MGAVFFNNRACSLQATGAGKCHVRSIVAHLCASGCGEQYQFAICSHLAT